MARVLYGEARGCSRAEQRLVVWCICNRVDKGSWGNTIEDVVKYPHQFVGHGATYPVWPELEDVAREVLEEWNAGGEADILEPYAKTSKYLYFSGDGKHNWYKDTYVPAEPEVTTEPPQTEAVTETESSRYLGTFKITGYYAAEGIAGQVSATGMPLVPWGTCAMNYYQIKELGLHYGDYITVEGVGTLKLVDNGCERNKVDVFVNNKSEAYAVTDLTKTRKVYVG